jgi:hypothetical protein
MPEHDGPSTTARVQTDRPARYGKQLVAHLSRRSVGAWDDEAADGWIDLNGSRVTLTSTDGALDLKITTSPEEVARLEDVVGRHLVRFGARDELVVRWARADGAPGTVQENLEDR